jgi:hypothetical protein
MSAVSGSAVVSEEVSLAFVSPSSVPFSPSVPPSPEASTPSGVSSLSPSLSASSEPAPDVASSSDSADDAVVVFSSSPVAVVVSEGPSSAEEPLASDSFAVSPSGSPLPSF